MGEFESLFEMPFEATPNLSFHVLFLADVVLFAVIATVGRSSATSGTVVLYLLLLPVYVAVRIRHWDRMDASEDGDPNENENE